jgi:dTDP-4-dehydrorhamnose 3,5-epimerase
MRVSETTLPGALLVEPSVFPDGRGFFSETFRASVLAEYGVTESFVQDNHSRSSRGVLRGIHFAVGGGSSKLVRCGRGKIWDVIVDLRRGSPAYGRWEGFELDDQQLKVLYVPVGFGHGFCVLSDEADVIYKQSAYYDPETERGIAWDDPDVAVEWPLPPGELIVSDRDAAAPPLADLAGELPFEYSG